MKKLVIFGAGKIAYAVSRYIQRWGAFDIAGYVADSSFTGDGTFLDRPLIPLDDMVERFPASHHAAFVAVGYQQLNALRREKVAVLRQLGYTLASVISPEAPTDLLAGENCFIAGAELLQPGIRCGDNVFIWSGAMVGHHSEIQSDVWITGGAAIGGIVRVGSGSFIGIGATIGHQVAIGANCMIGAGTFTAKDVPDATVLVQENTPPYRLNSSQFMRFSQCFQM